MRGSISKYKQQNGRSSWGYHFRPGKDENGKWIRVTKQGFKTKKEAEEKLEEAIKGYKLASKSTQQLNAPPKDVDTPPDGFRDFFTYWIDTHAKRHCAPKTAERYEELGRYAIDHFGDAKVNELNV